MSDEEFEDALARAAHGEVLTDLRPSPALLEALLQVAAARTPGERRPALRAARRLHEREAGGDDDGPPAGADPGQDDPVEQDALLEDLPDQDLPDDPALRGDLLLDDVLPRWRDDEEPPRR